MILNNHIISNAILKLKKTEYNLEDQCQKLKSLLKDMIEIENPKRYGQLELLLKEIDRAKDELGKYTGKLQKITSLYDSFRRESANLVDDLPILTDNHVLSEWISNIDVYGIENIENVTNPMLYNNILQHEDWLINRMFQSLETNED